VGGKTACEADLLFVIVDGERADAPGHWNVNSLTARMPRVTEWIEMHQPDVLCMQETKQADDKFPSSSSPSWATSPPTTATALERRRHHQQSGSRGRQPGFGTSDDDHGRRIVSAECAGTASSPSTSPMAAPSTTSSTRSSSRGWPVCGPPSTRCARRARRSPCAVTSMSPRGRRRVGSCRVRRCHARERSERAALREVEGWGSTTCSVASTTPARSRGGTTGRGLPPRRGMRIDLVLVSDDLVQRATGPSAIATPARGRNRPTTPP